MKTTIELSDALMDQAKSAARSQGITLKALIESGLRMALHPKNTATAQAAWPDLTFHPAADQSGSLLEASLWRDAANPYDGVRQA
ncbi:MAG: hypothetical protein WBK51_15525 [Polaromonas sp.]